MGGGSLITRRLVPILAMTLLLLGMPAVAQAGCSNVAHVIALSAGQATPGSGTTATSFAFSVTYSDTSGCVPASVVVKVSGGGTYPMKTDGLDFKQGVIFAVRTSLPLGGHSYAFSATSGTGNGQKTASLTQVSPASVQVSALPPNPTPQPTAPPSPTPTPDPTATPEPSTSSPDATGTATAEPTPTPVTAIVVGPGSPPPPAERGPEPAPAAGWLVPVGTWLGTTLGGLWIFLLLLPRRRQAPAVALRSMPTNFIPAASTAAPAAPSDPRGGPGSVGEPKVARWLRPSVQQARRAALDPRGRAPDSDGRAGDPPTEGP